MPAPISQARTPTAAKSKSTPRKPDKGRFAQQAIEVPLWLQRLLTPLDDGHLPGNMCDKPGGFHSQFKQLLSTITQPSKHHTLEDSQYGSNSYHFLERYVQCIKELYNSELESVDFMNATEEVRQKINSWVERQTNGDITNFFPANSIDQSTSMVLLNTVSFQGKWKMPFNPKDTQRGVFWTCKDQSIYVDMMTQSGRFDIANISNPPMQIIKELTYEKLQEWMHSESMKNIATKIYLPKFRVEDESILKSILKSILNEINFISYGSKANLSGMSGNCDLFVSQIHHKACIEVNEAGTEAAAAIHATTVSLSVREFRINRSFIFITEDTKTKSVIFMARISLP
ncbi:Ovalbumin, partial [Ophiophagus hannah]